MRNEISEDQGLIEFIYDIKAFKNEIAFHQTKALNNSVKVSIIMLIELSYVVEGEQTTLLTNNGCNETLALCL